MMPKLVTCSQEIFPYSSEKVYERFADIPQYPKEIGYSEEIKIIKKNRHGVYKTMKVRLPDGSFYDSHSVVRFFPDHRSFRVRQVKGKFKNLSWRLWVESLSTQACRVYSMHSFDIENLKNYPNLDTQVKQIEEELIQTIKHLMLQGEK